MPVMQPVCRFNGLHSRNPCLHYRPRRDGRLSWPSWLAHSGQYPHKVVTCQPVIGCRAGKVRRPKIDIVTTEIDGTVQWSRRCGSMLCNKKHAVRHNALDFNDFRQFRTATAWLQLHSEDNADPIASKCHCLISPAEFHLRDLRMALARTSRGIKSPPERGVYIITVKRYYPSDKYTNARWKEGRTERNSSIAMWQPGRRQVNNEGWRSWIYYGSMGQNSWSGDQVVRAPRSWKPFSFRCRTEIGLILRILQTNESSFKRVHSPAVKAYWIRIS